MTVDVSVVLISKFLLKKWTIFYNGKLSRYEITEKNMWKKLKLRWRFEKLYILTESEYYIIFQTQIKS